MIKSEVPAARTVKPRWVRPQLQRIEAGSAEARMAEGTPDGSETLGMARS